MSSKTTSSKAAKCISGKTANTILRRTELMSFDEASHICLADGAKVATDPDEYKIANELSYYILINTWLFQVEECSLRGSLDLHEAIAKKGLLAVIQECDDAASNMIAQYYHPVMSVFPHYTTAFLSSARDDQEALQLLRYPKRFSPDGADLVAKSSIDGLITINNGCKRINRNGFSGWGSYRPNYTLTTASRYWIDRISDRLSLMLDGYTMDDDLGFFSTGVAADSARPLATKLQAYASWECCLFHDPLYPIGHRTTVTSSDEAYTAKIVTVPKSHKAARVIAEEAAYRQFYMQAIRLGIEDALCRNGYQDYLDLHSQVRNQVYANLGSRNGSYATIDLSSASDSVARSLAYEVLPSAVVRDVDRYLPRFFSVNGRRRTMHMFCTSGSAVTFPVESVIFLAICLEVRAVVGALTGDLYLPPCVFGDDIVTDSALYDTTIDVLGQLGFTVNPTKSFGPGTSYRESCGHEYICGYDLVTRYWPRATLRWDKQGEVTAIAQLCSLEQKLYATYKCKVFLTNVVRSLEPRMTSHTPGTACVDLWEDIPVYKVTHAPGLSACTDDGALRHRHLVLRSRHRDRSAERGSCGFSNAQVLDMWHYARFLRFGPSFDDELLRLLGVSSKRATWSEESDTGEQYWGYVTE